MVQTLFGRLLHGLRVRKIRPCGFFLARGAQELVVGLLDSVNHFAVCVIEGEVRCQGFSFRGADSAGSRAEVKDRVIQIQYDLKVADGVTKETVRQVGLVAVNASQCRCRYCGIELAARDTPGGGLRAGAFSGNARLGIMRFRQIDQLRQCASLARIKLELGLKESFCFCLNSPFVGSMPRMVGGHRRRLSRSNSGEQQNKKRNYATDAQARRALFP